MKSELVERLRKTLADPGTLPLRNRMRTHFGPSLSYGRHFGPPTRFTKPAAVMVLLERRKDGWAIPLTLRPDHLPDHPGQISFPGGRLEAGETYLEAAEREFGEELGPNPFPGEVVGELRPIYVYNSDYYVRAFVAICDRQLNYSPCEQEVAQILHLPLASLANEAAFVRRDFARRGVQWKANAIEHAGKFVWGATAIMLGDLAGVLANFTAEFGLDSPPETRRRDSALS